MKLYDSQHPEGVGPNATPEGKQGRQEYANSLLMNGIKEPKEPIETWTDVKGYPPQEFPVGSGNYRTLQVNKKGEKRWNDEPKGYTPQTPQTKPGTSVFSVSLDTYAKSKGYGSFSEIPDEYKEKVKDYEIRKGVLDRTISRKSIVTKVMKDAEGHPFTATVTNYSGPAGNEILVDPMPAKKGDANTPNDTGKPTPKPPLVTPKDVRDKAKKLNPHASGSGNVTYSAPDTSIQMNTPEWTKLNNQHDSAVELVSEAQDVVANPNNSEMQFILVDNILHGALGRVNEIEINKIQNRGGWLLAPERWEQEASAGTMAPQLIKQLLDFTISQQKAIEKAMALQGGSTGETNANSGMSDDEFLMKVTQ
jgi:hypothetical protein